MKHHKNTRQLIFDFVILVGSTAVILVLTFFTFHYLLTGENVVEGVLKNFP